MLDNIVKFFKKLVKASEDGMTSKDAAKERLHIVLIQDRASVSADFLEVMKQEIIDVIKKYIDVDEKEIDVRLTNNEKEDGTGNSPALYANFPIKNVKVKPNETVKTDKEEKKVEEVKVENEDNISDNKEKEISQETVIENSEKEVENKQDDKELETATKAD